MSTTYTVASFLLLRMLSSNRGRHCIAACNCYCGVRPRLAPTAAIVRIALAGGRQREGKRESTILQFPARLNCAANNKQIGKWQSKMGDRRLRVPDQLLMCGSTLDHSTNYVSQFTAYKKPRSLSRIMMRFKSKRTHCLQPIHLY
jgi:hypothetical protein